MNWQTRIIPFAATLALSIGALTTSAHLSVANAQSADAVLCDRIAADPADPDKPADIKGVAAIAPADISTALKFCRTASGSTRRAMFALGRAYAANNQQSEAIGAWRKAADKGSTSAMVELGVAYATGAGVAKDDEQARKLFERAADAGNPRGVINLAALSGGQPSDPVRARALLEKSADTNAEAQFQLGMMMSEGIGGPKDDVAARALFEKAAAQNHAGALERMGAFTASGRGGPEDSDASKAYYERAAALGNEDAKTALKGGGCGWAIRDKTGKNTVTSLCF